MATSADAEMSESAEETVAQQGKEADKPEVSGNYVATDNDSNSPRFSPYGVASLLIYVAKAK